MTVPDLTGSVSLVVGASRGIGEALARVLAAAGAEVVLTARSAAAITAIAADIRAGGGRAAAYACDIADAAAVEALIATTVAKHGRIDHVINNAAVIAPVARLTAVDPEAWAGLISINVTGVFAVCRAVLPHLRRAGRGVIVNLSSGAAHRPVDGWSAYCASKAATRLFTEVMAVEEQYSGIRIYGFQPGAVDTGLLAQVRSAGLSEYSARSRDTLLPPELPARAIAWLCAVQPEDLSGQELTIRDAALRARIGLPERDYA